MRKEQEKFLARFMTKFDNPMKNPRMAKCQSLYYLALAASGPIVELGTYHGCGAIALGFGAKDGDGVPVFTIDDYQSRKGWAGEPYEPEDEQIAWSHIQEAGVEAWMIRQSTLESATNWEGMPSLIFWDTGTYDLEQDFSAWGSLLQPGGIFAVHDTSDRRFGSDKIFGEEWTILPELPGYIYCAAKRTLDN